MVNGKPRITSDNAKLKPWRQQITDTVFVESGGIPYSGNGKEAIALSLDFFFAKPPSAKKRTNVTVRPDVDKLIRACLDAMTGIVYQDDAQVVDVTARKHYGLPERLEIEVVAV